MANTLILCGGTGAHVGVAFLRLHTLGHVFGFFDQGDEPFTFPKIFLVDQDAGDGGERDFTAWQLARRLVDLHPAHFDWLPATGSKNPPQLIQVTPLPIGPNQQWYQAPANNLANRFEDSPYLEVFASQRQQEIDYSKGMMGSPSIGSLLFKLKEYDTRDKGLNNDETFGQLIQRDGRIVVAGSGVGGTGSSVAPTLAHSLAVQGGNRCQVMSVMVLNWFEFQEEGVADEIRTKAQLRNRIMNENANSALQFYGHFLSERVAAVPVGMPARALLKRHYTSDMQQPILESFVHAVAALSGVRHFLSEHAYGAGLYMMGAVDPGKLDGSTSIAGGTLQSLANQAATLSFTLGTWRRVLALEHGGRVTPAIYDAVSPHAEPGQVADHLKEMLEHYDEQLEWLKEDLGIEPRENRDFTYEDASRQRLGEERRGLTVKSDDSPAEVAAAIFHWTAEWIREEASPHIGLVLQPGEVQGGHWPELKGEGLAPAAEVAGDLTRLNDPDIDATLQAFVDPDYLSCNGWPHPIASADYFRRCIQLGDRVAFRQLELLLAGLVAGVLELEEIQPQGAAAPQISLENLLAEYRRKHGFPHMAEVKIVYPSRDRMVVGFNSPHTLLCPIPFMDDHLSNRLWDELWTTLSGASDGAPWNEAASRGSWGEYDLVVKQIKFWIEHQKRSHQGNAPPWLKVFASYSGGEANVPFGAGRLLKVFWGTPSVGDRPLVDLNLPTQDAISWMPPPGTPEVDEDRLFELVPRLAALEDGSFSMIEFEMPGQIDKVRGFWDEHLDALVKDGKIFLWSPGEGDGVIIGLMVGGGLHACTLVGSQLLSRSTVTVRNCTPLRQDPTAGSQIPEGDVLYPDLPIRGDYLDLVETPQGVHLLEALKKGDAAPFGEFRPTASTGNQGRRRVKWSLHLRGRKKTLPVEIGLEASGDHKAHWMVWPRFRSATGAGWKAYYVYENCTDRRLRLDTLWLDAGPSPEASRVRRRLADPEAVAYPVEFTTQAEVPAHAGGPPLALSLRNTARDEEQGLYLVPLKVLSDSPVEVSVGVDFGTSHSVAAVKVGDGDSPEVKPAQVELLHELDRANASKALTLHISENREHVEDPFDDGGILARGLWLPTYSAKKGGGFLPSELLVLERLKDVRADTVKDWLPAATFWIPPMDIGREDLSDHVLTDFKWNVSVTEFRGREGELREHYLGMLLELVMADIVANHVGNIPRNPVNMTFTYPLRSTEKQIEVYTESLQRVVRRGSNSLGIPLGLQNEIGIYDESRAARLTTQSPGEVVLVGDLGGGTLDLFIAAQGGSELAEVADSARLGGNLLLRQIASSPQGFLPRDGNWGDHLSDPKDTETKLRAWMRSEGSSRIFGLDAGGRPELKKMNLRGFSQAAEAARARKLLNRYFRLIVEYMARNLVAYLVGHWYDTVDRSHYGRLKISIQLRGNGWRLRYQDETYTQATEAIRDQVRQRAETLWGEIKGNPIPFPGEDRHWESAGRYAVTDPKAAPIKSVVGKAMSFREIKGRWYSHTLVDLEVIRSGDSNPVDWFQKIPFDTRGSRQVHIDGISPPLVLSSPKQDEVVEISELEAGHQGRINEALQTESVTDEETGDYWAQVAPLVWEAVFESRNFWPDEG